MFFLKKKKSKKKGKEKWTQRGREKKAWKWRDQRWVLQAQAPGPPLRDMTLPNICLLKSFSVSNGQLRAVGFCALQPTAFDKNRWKL